MSYQDCKPLDIGCHFDNFVLWFEYRWDEFWTEVGNIMIAMLSVIPVPEWMNTTTFTLPPGVLWFANALEFQAGFSMIISAYLLRFTIRRLPIFG